MSQGQIRIKALRYIRDGNVTLRTVVTHPGERRACEVDAKVNTTHGIRSVRYAVGDPWWCSCGGNGDAFSPCAHVAAVQMLTGHPSAALRLSAEERA